MTLSELAAKTDADRADLIAYDRSKATDRATQLRLNEALAIMERIGIGGEKPTHAERLVRTLLDRAAARQAARA